MRWLAAGALLPLAACAFAADGALQGSLQGDPKPAAAVQWLQRIAGAATSVNYQGTMVFSSGNGVYGSRLTRYCTPKDSFEQSESLDGPPRIVYRHNETVHTLWPARKVAMVEQRDALSPRGGFAAAPADLLNSYDVKLEGLDRVASHRAQVLLLAPRDEHRYAQRLWADEATGLMLRAEVLDADQRVLESTAFTELKTGVRPQPDLVAQAMRKLDGYQVVKAAIERTKLESEGWKLEVPVAGFRQISCVKRPVAGGEPKPGAPMIVQSIYSDGLVHVSVFIEPYVADRHQSMMSSYGATRTLAQQRGDAWVTVVGDVPAPTVQRFATALERLH